MIVMKSLINIEFKYCNDGSDDHSKVIWILESVSVLLSELLFGFFKFIINPSVISSPVICISSCVCCNLINFLLKFVHFLINFLHQQTCLRVNVFPDLFNSSLRKLIYFLFLHLNYSFIHALDTLMHVI